MVKDMFGNTLTPMKLGGLGFPQKKENKRQPVAGSQKKAVFIRQNGKCTLCKKQLIGSIHYDHIKEVSKGGKSITGNLRAICASCHDKRHILDKAKEMDKKRNTRGKNNSLGSGLFGNIPKRSKNNPFRL